LIYLDSAASSQKPQCVIDKTVEAYSLYCANIHRGIHYLSERASREFESSREVVANFIGAENSCEIIFVRGTTEAINLVAATYGQKNISFGDEILISHMEHHSNIVPWQMLCKKKGATLKVIPINDAGELIFDEYLKLLNKKTKLVAITHVSNALGSINPVKKIIREAHKIGVKVLLDGAQAVPHMIVNVTELDCDFYTFSGHKMFGPTGVGILYGKKDLLEQMPPYQGGGNMIKTVSFKKTTYLSLPFKFEAGTPNIVGVIGLKAAIEYLQNIGLKEIFAYENQLLRVAINAFKQIQGLNLIGTAKTKVSVLSFVLKGIHPHDISSILDRQGIAIRAGHLCAQPLMVRFGVASLCRVSLTFYNTKEEIGNCVMALKKVQEVIHV